MSRDETRRWEDVGADWSARRPQRTWRAYSDAVNQRLLERWHGRPAAGRVLKTDAFDEAFGEGLASWLSGGAASLVLVDVSLPTLRAVRAGAREARLVCGDARELPFKGAVFEAACSLSTLDHFATRAELERGLAELARVIRPGARAVVTLDNPEHPLVAIRNRLPGTWLRRAGLLPYPVGVTLPRDALVAALEHAGFAVRDVRAVLHVPRVLAVAAARVLDRLDHRALRRAFFRLAAGFEGLGETPLRFRTGHFVAALAERR